MDLFLGTVKAHFFRELQNVLLVLYYCLAVLSIAAAKRDRSFCAVLEGPALVATIEWHLRHGFLSLCFPLKIFLRASVCCDCQVVAHVTAPCIVVVLSGALPSAAFLYHFLELLCT